LCCCARRDAADGSDLRKALPPKEKSNLYYRELSDEIRRELWQRFRSGLEPLRRSGKLGVVLLQFAPWFVFGRESFEHILHCADMLEGFPLAVEFRNKSWFGEKTRSWWSTSRRGSLRAFRRYGRSPAPISPF